MDHLIQNGFSNLEIETQHPHSSSQKEDEVKRNWLELPPDVTTLIFLKLGTVDILGSAQWVCTSWWKLSKQPNLFRSIHVKQVLTLFGRSVHDFTSKLSGGLAREAIDRSSGQLVEFSVGLIATDELLHYMSAKSSSLRGIRVVSSYGAVSDDGLIKMAKQLPQLEKLEMIHCAYFSNEVFETFGRFCPHLKSCRLNYVNYFIVTMFHGVAAAIAHNMPELRYLNLFGNKLRDEDVRAILDGCPHLESLDLRQCSYVKFTGDLKERCKNIKVLRLPNDPTDDFEYELRNNDYDFECVYNILDNCKNPAESADVYFGYDTGDEHEHLEQSLMIIEKTVLDTSVPLKVFVKFKRKRLVKMAKEAVDRSCGQLIQIPKFLRLVSCDEVTADGLTQVCKQFPQLEKLELYSCSFSEEAMPQLRHLNLFGNRLTDDGLRAIAQNMPELRYLNLFGNRLTDDGLKAVLDGCPHLESLDLRQCFNLKFTGVLKVRCGNIKVLRLPNDPTGDFEYEIPRYATHDFSDSDSDSNSYSDDVYHGSDDYDYD